MVKLVYCISRKQGLGREEFRRYWAEVHGRRSPEWQASTADEAHFVDPVRCANFVSEERQIL